ncbi:MAG: sulfatase-like hydrolase/transferase [Deltaproteobacteria bacterium]|nr:sulfatase-like hydrolase/transferase [Deltaproteobacteria bacterium]
MNDHIKKNRVEFNRREFLKLAGAGASAVALWSVLGCKQSAPERPPNIVLIFTDDQGYADLGCYGAQGFSTPNIDRLAQEGMRFTDFYVASPVCTPSRAALLTGCYPQRVGLPNVVGPPGPAWTRGLTNIGFSSEETTIADMLKPLGYRTGCFGKWHLGHLPPFLPTRHGFDEFFGIPYSNDMRPDNDPAWPDLPLMEGESITEKNPDQSQLTTRLTERALNFIDKNREKPFFLYIPYTMPHIPLYVSDKFKGRSEKGLYGDVIMEIDSSVGEMMKKLKQLDLDDNTLVVFMSDNGPWLLYGNHGGSASPLREGKRTTFEGGQRVPCIMRWPGKIPAGKTCNEMATTMDLLPTISHLTGAALPPLKIDGKNIWPLVNNLPDAKSPHEAFYYYLGNELQAVRSGKWKLHLPHLLINPAEKGHDGIAGKVGYKRLELALYNLEEDIGEQTNVADQYPDIVARLSQLAREFDAELKQNARPPGRVEL